MRQFIGALVLIGVSLVINPSPVVAGRVTYITIGTGALTGVYYPVGGAISRIFNKKSSDYGLRLTVESTNGSVFNANAVMSGDLELGIVQSDRQYQAFNGTKNWQDRPQKNLRSLFSLHLEPVSIVAAVDANIKQVSGLKKKAVNIGNPGSGQRGNALDILSAVGLDWQRDIRSAQLKAEQAAGALQEGAIDAFFYTVGHPNESIKKATSGVRKTRFVPLSPEIIKILVEQHPYYVSTSIPVVHYPGVDNTTDVPTIGVKGTVCASSELSEEVAYLIVKEVFDNLEEFKALHPALSSLTRTEMLSGLSAPLHPGAEKYFREVGLLK